MMRKQTLIFQIALLCSILLAAIVFAVSVGSASISMLDSLRILLGYSYAETVHETIIWRIRLPRVLLSGLVGAGLALSGATFQGLFQNPLADPHILGVSSGAALGATLAMILGVSSAHFIGVGSIGVFAFIGAVATTVIVYNIARTGSRVSTVHIVLAGASISSMLSAIISIIMIFNREQIERVYFWTMGSFSSASWDRVNFMVVFVIICGSVLILYSRRLDAMATGDDTAASVGVDTVRTKKILILATSLLVAACVSVSGIIGFVGLIIPHIMRLLVGSTHIKLLTLSALGGAIFMILCDTFARTIVSPSELPVGAVTALFGGPYFIFLLYKSKKKVF